MIKKFSIHNFISSQFDAKPLIHEMKYLCNIRNLHYHLCFPLFMFLFSNMEIFLTYIHAFVYNHFYDLSILLPVETSLW